MINHHFYSLLKYYLNSEEDEPWVMATVVDKQGSSYRYPGAMMLVSPLGKYYGLVSGGCLEADIVRHAQQVMQTQQARYVVYDMFEDGSFAAVLSTGCHGRICVLLQYLTLRNRRVLEILYNQLQTGHRGFVVQGYEPSKNEQEPIANDLFVVDGNGQLLGNTNNQTDTDLPTVIYATVADITADGVDKKLGHRNIEHDLELGTHWSVTLVVPPVNLWVFGAGADARSVVRIAGSLGWRVTLIDHRPAYARSEYFEDAERILRQHPRDLSDPNILAEADAAVLMTHNLNLDSQWLGLLAQTTVRYVGLLGPEDRRQRVLAQQPQIDTDWLDEIVQGPAGLDIGGELPESIALSILAQCHACLHGVKCNLSHMQTP